MGGTDQSGANGLSCKVFLLSGIEVGYINDATYSGSDDGAKLAYFPSGNESNSKRAAKFNGSAIYWWTRSPSVNYETDAVYVSSNGKNQAGEVTNTYGIRPAIVMPSDLLVDDNNNILPATYPTPPASITVPISSIPTGSSIAVSWSSVSGAESYQLQRSVDGGAWETVYTGTQTSYSDTAGVWNSVKYQVATVKLSIVSG